MKNIILLLLLVVGFNIPVSAEEDEPQASETKKNAICDNEAARNAFFLIRSNTKEEIEARIRETRQTIDSCESNEEGKVLTDQIALMEETLGGAPKGDTPAKEEATSKDDKSSNESSIAKSDVPVKEEVKAQIPVSTEEPVVEVKKEKPVVKPVSTKSVKVKPDIKPEEIATVEAVKPVVPKEKPAIVVKPEAPVKSNERQLLEGMAKRAGNVAVNIGTATKDVSVALVDPDYWESVGDRVNELKQKAVTGVKSLVTPSPKGTQVEDGRGYLERAAGTAKNVGGFVADKESWKGMGRNGVKLVTSIWDNSGGKVYEGAKVLADGRNDTFTNLQAMNNIAAGSVSTVVNGAGVVNGARAAATKAVTYFRTPAGEVVQVTTAANGVVTQKVIRNVTEKASDQAMGSVNTRPPGP